MDSTKDHGLQDDGLHTPVIGKWGKEKYRLFKLYADMFAKSMKRKWGKRIYIDLFAGAGRAKIESTGEIVEGSPLLALGLPCPFDQYILCDEDEGCANALEKRIKGWHEKVQINIIRGDANERIEEIIAAIPRFGRGNTGLCFCFVDPYKARNFKFHTIEKLATARRCDFMVLLPTHMDVGRNVGNYVRPDDPTLDNFLGDVDWRTGWQQAQAERKSVRLFLVDFFGAKMQSLGYIYTGAEETELIRNYEKNAPLYRLAFFSKSAFAVKLWKEARKYRTAQQSFDFI